MSGASDGVQLSASARQRSLPVPERGCAGRAMDARNPSSNYRCLKGMGEIASAAKRRTCPHEGQLMIVIKLI